jgi:deazaflavin-dependent oxidoreductase (nitroreductase family)
VDSRDSLGCCPLPDRLTLVTPSGVVSRVAAGLLKSGLGSSLSSILGTEVLVCMPLPRSVARFNRHVTNRVLGPLAPYLPHFAMVIHRGRRSGRLYRNPINVFARRGGFIAALTYGPRSDWVQNVLAGGWCLLETRGEVFQMTSPRLVHDPAHRSVPPFLRSVGRLGRVDYFLDLSLAPPASPSNATT